MKYVPSLGRILLAVMFLMTAVMDIANFSGMRQCMASMRMPLTVSFLIGAVVLKIAGELSVLPGCKARWGAPALIIFPLPTTLIFHIGFADRNQAAQFFKNTAMIGGLMLVAAFGSDL